MICPIISRCSQQVDLNHYLHYCSHPTEENYRKCQYFISLQQQKKTPSEWSEAVTGIRVRLTPP